MNARIILLLTMLVFGAAAVRADSPEHSRVAELEDSLTKDANIFLKGRFPDLPFLVTVKVDAMFRGDQAARNVAGEKGEKLPYFDSETEEIRDEWDDPELPLLSLMRRVRKALVTISIPNSVSEADATELKESLFSVLHMNPARDEILVQRRNWRHSQVGWETFAIAFLVIGLLLGGLTLINRASSQRIAKALVESRAAGPSVPVAPSVASAQPEQRNGQGGGMGGNLQVSDPVKLKDIVVRSVDVLAGQAGFPNALDVFELDAFGRREPAKLGALLLEFSPELQNRIFGLSAGDWWMQALNNPGLLDLETLDVLQRLMRNPRDASIQEWNHLVLSVWRLGEQRVQFLRGIPKEEALQVLSALPKGMALEAARKVFPGAWASVLDVAENKIVMPNKRALELSKQAQTIKPLRDRVELRHFHERLELLEHLRIADVYEEKEIYEALPEKSPVFEARPPFYKMLEATPDQLKRLAAAFTLDDWSRVLVDLRTGDREKIESHFSDKQRFILTQKMMAGSFGRAQDKEGNGRLRERMARQLVQVRDEMKQEAAAEAVSAEAKKEPKDPREMRRAA